MLWIAAAGFQLGGLKQEHRDSCIQAQKRPARMGFQNSRLLPCSLFRIIHSLLRNFLASLLGRRIWIEPARVNVLSSTPEQVLGRVEAIPANTHEGRIKPGPAVLYAR